jgi:phosphatidylglycerophosphatase C
MEVIKFQKGKTNLYKGLLLNLPYVLAYKIKLITNQRAKEKILQYFFKGMDLMSFQNACDAFADKALPLIIRPGARAEIKKLQESGFEVVIVSASAENWINKWSTETGIKLIGSQLQTNDNMLTGNLNGRNCNGEEKANRIKSAYDLSQYDEVFCYGDTKGDKAMFALATKSFFKPFRS